ncbi:hypothetical protein D9613_012840 [Agrocybe pediades]|uniref:Ubiquitin-like protease family profile domain-containing protein n=1 Tax=Agrocybe pediades TaxID=84607 RepID=A0A8H4VQ67_9AGAR|nr:hypothetical protein D9613_012840 [Agrocybe pediades]
MTTPNSPMILDVDEKFQADKWFGHGINYNSDTLPACVTEEKEKSEHIPPELDNFSVDLSVTQFLQHTTPKLSAEIIHTKTTIWFSRDEPMQLEDVKSLLSRPVPSKDFLAELDAAYGQAWLDGATSIIDPRFNEGRERLPMWMLAYWKKATEVNEMQELWRKGVIWLRNEGQRLNSTALPETIEKATRLLDNLHWNTPIRPISSHFSYIATTLFLAKFLGTFWLNDEHINMMIEQLRENASKRTSGTAQQLQTLSTVVEDLSFPLAIHNLPKDLSKEKNKRIIRLGQLAKDGTMKKLYFPLHVNSTHWIAVMIDFEGKSFSFGA